jgi:predicted RNase H-like HicB family nuclease
MKVFSKRNLELMRQRRFNMEYHFKLHREEEGGLWAECIELKGCLSDGDSFEELKLRLTDALNLYLNEPVGSNQIFPLPDKSLNGNLELCQVRICWKSDNGYYCPGDKSFPGN